MYTLVRDDYRKEISWAHCKNLDDWLQSEDSSEEVIPIEEHGRLPWRPVHFKNSTVFDSILVLILTFHHIPCHTSQGPWTRCWRWCRWWWRDLWRGRRRDRRGSLRTRSRSGCNPRCKEGRNLASDNPSQCLSLLAPRHLRTEGYILRNVSFFFNKHFNCKFFQ